MVFLVHWYTIILYLLPSVRCRCLVQSRRPTIANRYFAMRIPTSDQAARRFAGFACFFLLHISGAAVPPVLHMRPPFSPLVTLVLARQARHSVVTVNQTRIDLI